MRIDLHTHSNASDGTDRPGEVVRRAREAGLDVLALTDHDTVAGHREAAAALPPGLTLVPGIELSCLYDGSSVHLLGYLFDPAEPELAAELEEIRGDRVRRGREMVDRLAELGAPVSWGQVRRIAGRAAVVRPHIAQAMVESGVVDSVADAFTPEWIAAGGRAYVDRYGPSPDRAIAMIRKAGGVTVLAHPYVDRGNVLGDDVLARLAAGGLDGVEVDHPDHEPADRARLRGLAEDLGLVVTGSSDDHGGLTGHRLGCETTAVQVYEVLVARASGAAPQRPGEDSGKDDAT